MGALALHGAATSRPVRCSGGRRAVRSPSCTTACSARRFAGQGNADAGLAPPDRARPQLADPEPARRSGGRRRASSASAWPRGSPGRRSGASPRPCACRPRTGGRCWCATSTARAPPTVASPDAELLRAAEFASSAAARDDVVVLAGDFNVTSEESPVLRSLADERVGLHAARPGHRPHPRARGGAGARADLARSRSRVRRGPSCRIMHRWRWS